eukprot:10762045-Prorocentrum_lima.AAC.1
MMGRCAPGLLAWAKDQEVRYSGVSQVVPRSRSGHSWEALIPERGDGDDEWSSPVKLLEVK